MSITSSAIRMLRGESVVLENYSKTKLQFLVELPIAFAASVMCWFLITSLIFITWPEAFNVLLNPIGFGLCFVIFAAMSWHDIDMRKVYVEPKHRSLTIINKGCCSELETQQVSFDRSLLVRYWSSGSEGESAYFVIELIAPRIFYHLIGVGYSLHREIANDNPEQADRITDDICRKLSAQFDI
ncbi:hypothetical protein SAMN02745887_02526 [Chitinimonas taiwanensis DSM 18899]|uniref:YcxB-like protein n=1 Tax=Chitinimonas taiwanensis DSM 18899 TaxID=1121279 RepID=A0A1K2HLN3_9NEIS|nr:hypothetical protein SAMN02745887_02526 [Chitinimonas taiwanensis DSM 18899]